MKPKNSGSGRRIVCLVLVAVMLLGLISSALIIMVNAASSSEIKKELNGLRSQQAELKKEREALQAKIKENQSKTQTLVEKKSDIDQQISMTQASIDSLLWILGFNNGLNNDFTVATLDTTQGNTSINFILMSRVRMLMFACGAV